MKILDVRNVQHALPIAISELLRVGVRRDSRNGPVLVFPEPVTTIYRRPAERVLFWAQRDANPFFHLYESLWMLAGRRDVEGPAGFVANMRNFSDDGVTFHGAYGHRWRQHFDRDQLPLIIEALRANPDDRRQVLSMWDARSDLGRAGKDLPCNLQALFQIAPDGRLDMTVTNRSNDLIWGAYGANAVHFSYLHEFAARAIGVEQGVYRQMSNNLHAYLDTLQKVETLSFHADPMSRNFVKFLDPYTLLPEMKPFPLMTIPYKDWLEELNVFLDDPDIIGLKDGFFRRVAAPMMRAHRAYRENVGAMKYAAALPHLHEVAAPDWRLAGLEWIERRREAFEKRKARAQDDGPSYPG